jgi:trimeric autotransporter adhesin
VIDVTRTDVTVLNADGSQTETVTDVNGTSGSLRDQTVTTTSAAGTNVSIARDTTGAGFDDQTETISTAANGNIVDSVSNFNANGSLLSQAVTTTVADGLTKTLQTDSTGDGVFDQTQTVTTVFNANGSTTVTSTTMNGTTATGSTTVTTAADGLSSITLFENGAGTILDERTDTRVLNANGSTTETVSDANTNGALIDQTVTTVSADGKTTTITGNNNGGSEATSVETIAEQSNGSIVDTVEDFSASGALIAQTVKTTSANGLSTTLTQDENGDGTVDNRQTDTTVLGEDGSTTETYTDSNGNLNSNGGITDSTKVLTTTSVNGLDKTIVTTGNDQDFTDNNTVTDDTVINADDSRTETRTITGVIDGEGDTGPWSTEITTTSANGLSQTTLLSDFGDSTYDVTDAVVIGVDGTKTETVTVLNPNGSLFEKDVTTTSANGQSVSLQGARLSSSTFNHFETIVTNSDGGVTDTVSDTNSSGATTDQIITTTSADGFDKAVQIEPDDGSTVEQTTTDVTTLNANGSTTLVQSVLNGNGTVRSQETRTTSANGLDITTAFGVSGDGATDETTTDDTVLNADGSKTETVTTEYANGTEKSQSVTTTSANGLGVTTALTIPSVAIVIDAVSVSSTGVKTETLDDENASGSLVSATVTTTSADGRNISVDHENSSGQITTSEQTLVQDGANGSFEWIEDDGSGNFIAENAHLIDANGTDGFNLVLGKQTFSENLSLSQEANAFAEVTRLYGTLLDRAPNSIESQTWFQFYGQSGLSLSALASTLMSSSEFSQKFGSMTNTEVVEQIYQNALGRNVTMSELSNWLSQLSAGTATQTSMAVSVSESSEHIADGNVYQVTNDTYNTSGTFTLSHTIDTAVADATIDNLYETALGRAVDPPGLASYSADLLDGTMTQPQIAAALIGSSEFASKYGAVSNADFVSQIFVNALGRLPTAAEAQEWIGALNSAAISQADFVAAIAQSPDHLQTENQQVTTLTVTGAANTIHASGDTLNFSAGAGGTVDSGGNAVSLPSSAAVTINGGGATINVQSGDTVAFSSSLGGTVDGSGATVSVASGDTITLGPLATANGGDTVVVSGTDNTLIDSGGSSTLEGNLGSNTLIGGVGTTADFGNATSGVVVNLAAGRAQNGNGGTDTLSGIHDLIGSSFADTLIGDSGTDTLDGGGGSDTLEAGSGNDTFVFGRGYGFDTIIDNVEQFSTTTGTTTTPVVSTTSSAVVTAERTSVISGKTEVTTTVMVTSFATETVTNNVVNTVTTTVTTHVDGGADTLLFKSGVAVSDLMIEQSGNNLVVALRNPSNPSAAFSAVTDQVTLVNWFNPLDQVQTFSFANGTSINVANMSFQQGTTGSQTLVGSGTNNWLIAGTGNDTLIGGGSGTDILVGGPGNDTLEGGSGTNLLFGGNGGSSTALYTGASKPVVVNLATGIASNGFGGTDTLTNISDVTVTESNSTLIGGSGSEVLQAAGGSGDTLIGGSGATTLISDAAGNTLEARTGRTSAEYINLSGLTVNLATATASISGSASDTLIGIGAVALSGGSKDTVVGGSGSDLI